MNLIAVLELRQLLKPEDASVLLRTTIKPIVTVDFREPCKFSHLIAYNTLHLSYYSTALFCGNSEKSSPHEYISYFIGKDMRLDTITYLCIVLVTRVPSRDCSAYSYSGVIKAGVTRCGN